ncbi:MAG: hypothetical protein OER86_14530, partial [Phycisphaerae bacterium]|nr:hypothetical protein [Phycisphaerae bacterium]
MKKASLFLALAPLTSGAALAEAGLNSSSSPAFDFRTNGSALPMYALFLLSVILLVAGIVRQIRRLGPARGNEAAAAG